MTAKRTKGHRNPLYDFDAVRQGQSPAYLQSTAGEPVFWLPQCIRRTLHKCPFEPQLSPFATVLTSLYKMVSQQKYYSRFFSLCQ